MMIIMIIKQIYTQKITNNFYSYIEMKILLKRTSVLAKFK
jgi:hypothetical protein